MDAVQEDDGPRRALRQPGRLARCVLMITSLVLTLAVGEIALRIFKCPPRTATVLSTFFRPDAELGWIGRPDAACQFVTSSFDVQITHGPDGFRACPGAAAASEDTEQVWCLGDSHVWGWGVPDGQTFVDLLNRHAAPRRTFRNLGVSGFNSVQEYLLLEKLLKAEPAPREVLVMFCDNDPADNLSAAQPHLVPSGESFVIAPAPGPSWGRRAGSWLKLNSLAFNYLNFYFMRARKRVSGETTPGVLRPLSAEATARPAPSEAAWNDSPDWRALHHSYHLMRELCREHGVALSVIWQDERAVDPRLVAVTKDLGLKLLDLSGSLRQQRVADNFEGSIMFALDGHYNRTGHVMVAKAIESQLRAPAVARRP